MPIYKTKRKTKDGRCWYYQVNFINPATGKYCRHTSHYYATRAEAQHAEAVYLSGSVRVSASRVTIDDLWKEYISQKEQELKPQSVAKLRVLYRYLKPFKNLKAEKLTVARYEAFKADLRETGLSVPYLNKIHRLFEALLRYGEKYHGITNNAVRVAGGFKAPDQERKKMEFYTLEEYTLFREQIPDLVWLTFFDTLYYLGLRKNEANALNWNDLDLQGGTVSISKTVVTKIKGMPYLVTSPKTRSSNRILPAPKLLIREYQELKRYYQKFPEFSEDWFVFGGIKPLAETTIDKKNRQTAAAAGLKRIRIHDFRHSCASLLINSGANVTIVAQYMGHSNIEMTLNTYSHFYESKLEEVAEIIDRSASACNSAWEKTKMP